jgi:hypothetical protein
MRDWRRMQRVGKGDSLKEKIALRAARKFVWMRKRQAPEVQTDTWGTGLQRRKWVIRGPRSVGSIKENVSSCP